MRQMNNNDSILTHHEQLRLDYLQKNIHYLNERESRELEYLLYKKESLEIVIQFLNNRSHVM